MSLEKRPLKKFKTMLANGTTYSVTLNMSKQKFGTNSINRPRLLVEQYTDFMKANFADWCDYQMIPEISIGGRFHYHGRLKMNDSFLFHLIYSNKISEHANLDIDTIDDDEVWTAYLEKDKELMEKELHKMHLPYQINNNTAIKKERKKSGIYRFLDESE